MSPGRVHRPFLPARPLVFFFVALPFPCVFHTFAQNAKVVQEVLLNIIDHSPELQGRPWRIHLSADEAFNAFSFHSGTVYLTMGLCRELHSRSELACILGHEMAHVVAKHSYERFTVANMFTVRCRGPSHTLTFKRPTTPGGPPPPTGALCHPPPPPSGSV